MKITTDFIHKHRTPRGGFSKAQLYALGIEWPPVRGWIVEAAAREHTEAAIKAFVEFGERDDIAGFEVPNISPQQPSLF